MWGTLRRWRGMPVILTIILFSEDKGHVLASYCSLRSCMNWPIYWQILSKINATCSLSWSKHCSFECREFRQLADYTSMQCLSAYSQSQPLLSVCFTLVYGWFRTQPLRNNGQISFGQSRGLIWEVVQNTFTWDLR